MKILFDFGNSSLKWAMSENGLKKAGTIQNSESTKLVSSLDRAFVDLGKPEAAWISSVASSIATQDLQEWVQRKWSLNAQMIKPVASGYGVTSNYEPPGSLGSDRWAAMIAIRHRYHQPATIVDCGTAVTIDFLNNDQFYGSVILPGLDVSRKSLFANTAGIETASTDRVNSIATNTASAVHSGTILALAGGIASIIQQQQNEMECTSTVYLTGGAASQLLPYLSFESVLVADLVLQGIEVIAGTDV